MFISNPIKMVIRKTGQEVEVVAHEVHDKGKRSDADWVTFIDKDGKEHIQEHMNLYLDLSPREIDPAHFAMNVTYLCSHGGYSVDAAIRMTKQIYEAAMEFAQ